MALKNIAYRAHGRMGRNGMNDGKLRTNFCVAHVRCGSIRTPTAAKFRSLSGLEETAMRW
jgi:hypothetical protein